MVSMVLLKPKEENFYFFKHDTGSRLIRDEAFPTGGNAEVDGAGGTAAAGVKPNPSPLAVYVMALACSYCCSCISNT